MSSRARAQLASLTFYVVRRPIRASAGDAIQPRAPEVRTQIHT